MTRAVEPVPDDPPPSIQRTTADLVEDSRLRAGDPWQFRLNRELLPPVPPEVHTWIAGSDDLCLYLHGPAKSGKTWLGIFAAYMRHRDGMAYWSERRFISDLNRLRWYERMVTSDRNEQLFEEYDQFEKSYLGLVYSPMLIVDELFYWNVQDFLREELLWVIKQRLDNGLLTVVCAKEPPPVGSVLRPTIELYGSIVMLEEL